MAKHQWKLRSKKQLHTKSIYIVQNADRTGNEKGTCKHLKGLNGGCLRQSLAVCKKTAYSDGEAFMSSPDSTANPVSWRQRKLEGYTGQGMLQKYWTTTLQNLCSVEIRLDQKGVFNSQRLFVPTSFDVNSNCRVILSFPPGGGRVSGPFD